MACRPIYDIYYIAVTSAEDTSQFPVDKQTNQKTSTEEKVRLTVRLAQ